MQFDWPFSPLFSDGVSDSGPAVSQQVNALRDPRLNNSGLGWRLRNHVSCIHLPRGEEPCVHLLKTTDRKAHDWGMIILFCLWGWSQTRADINSHVRSSFPGHRQDLLARNRDLSCQRWKRHQNKRVRAHHQHRHAKEGWERMALKMLHMSLQRKRCQRVWGSIQWCDVCRGSRGNHCRQPPGLYSPDVLPQRRPLLVWRIVWLSTAQLLGDAFNLDFFPTRSSDKCAELDLSPL